MSALIWVTLLFAIRCTDAKAALSPMENPAKTTKPEIPDCVTIPCNYAPDPEHVTGSKCVQNCALSTVLVNLNNTNSKTHQSGEGGSLLGLNLTGQNCIIIHNISKLHKLTVRNGIVQGFRIAINDLTKRPIVLVPRLTEGQIATLTCTAPVPFCSGSAPKITWMWNGRKGNVTDPRTESQTASGQIHSSNLTFNASFEQHGAQVTCKVTFMNISMEETVTLNVTYVKKLEITGTTTVKQGDGLNLTCSLESFPPASVEWTKADRDSLRAVTETVQQNNSVTALLMIPNVTVGYSGEYICTATHLNLSLTESKNITVSYFNKPEISGETNVKEGGILNLTCTVDSFPPYLITWTKLPHQNLNNDPTTHLGNDTGKAALVIENVTAEDSGQYICTANLVDGTMTKEVTITVIPNLLSTILTMQANVPLYLKILNTSGCRRVADLLTCECVSEGFPVPVIKWPQLENVTEYSVLTTISSYTITSSINLTMRNQSAGAGVECVSRSGNKEVNKTLTIRKMAEEKEEEDSWMKWLNSVQWLEVIIAFFTGALLSAVFCCCIRKCHRKKQKTYRGLAETLEMMPSQEESLIDAGQAAEDGQAIYQVAVEAKEDEAQATEQEAAEAEGDEAQPAEAEAAVGAEMSDTDYCDLDFSLMKRPSLAKEELEQTPETEYAEIKKEKVMVREDGEDKEEEEMIEEDEEPKLAPNEEEEDELAALYSTVKNAMNEV